MINAVETFWDKVKHRNEQMKRPIGIFGLSEA